MNAFLPASVFMYHMCNWCQQKPKEVIRSPGIGVPPWGFWSSNVGGLEEQPVHSPLSRLSSPVATLILLITFLVLSKFVTFCSATRSHVPLLQLFPCDPLFTILVIRSSLQCHFLRKRSAASDSSQLSSWGALGFPLTHLSKFWLYCYSFGFLKVCSLPRTSRQWCLLWACWHLPLCFCYVLCSPESLTSFIMGDCIPTLLDWSLSPASEFLPFCLATAVTSFGWKWYMSHF